MSKLTKLLEYANADNSQKKVLRNKSSFKRQIDKDTIKKLTVNEETNEDELVREEVLDTIIRGASYYCNMRKAIPTVHAPKSYKARAVTGSATTYADEVPESGKIPMQNAGIDSTDVTIHKFGTRPVITNEMVEDCEYDAIEIELEYAGRRMENALNRFVLGEILDNCTGTDTDVTISTNAVVDAMEKIKNENFMPDTIIMHPRAEAQLFDTVSVFNKDLDLTRTGEGTPEIFGMRRFCSNVTTSSTATSSWDSTNSANHYYAMILDSSAYARTVIKRDMMIKDYKDPVHDLTNLVVSSRFGVGVTNGKAGVRFLTN